MSLAELQELERTSVVHSYARMPVEFVRGEGARLWDAEGNEYLDFLCGISVTNLGHCHPRVVEAVREQVGQLMHVSNLFYTEPAMRLAERLSESSLGGKVFFCNSGAEANEAAIKLARKARAGGDVVVVNGAFHGRTYGALSATPQEAKQAPFAPLVPGFRAVEADAGRAARGRRRADRRGAPRADPGGDRRARPLRRAAGGRTRGLRRARRRADLRRNAVRHGPHRHRCGPTSRSGVKPDAMTVAKALGGGLPIGALITGERLADVFVPGDHGSTFAGGPVVAAAALAALELTDDEQLLERVRELGQRARRRRWAPAARHRRCGGAA